MVKERETALNSFFERVSTPKEVSAFNIFSIMLTEKNNALFINNDANLKEAKLHLSKIKNTLDALFALSDVSGLVKNQNFLLHYFLNVESRNEQEFCETFVDNTHFTTNHLINCLVELYEQYKNMQS